MHPFLLFSDTSVLFLSKNVPILVKKKIFLKGITVFLSLAEAYLTVKIVRQLAMSLCKRSKIAPEIYSPVDFFNRLLPNTCLRR